jgi:hypothetical protein
MKNKNLAFLAIILIWTFLSCKKAVNDPSLDVRNKGLELKAAKEKLIIALSEITSVSKEFKSLVEKECLKQENGDYQVRLEKLIQIDDNLGIVPQKYKASLRSIYHQMKSIDPVRVPIIFVPVMEKRDPANLNSPSPKNPGTEKIIENNSKNSWSQSTTSTEANSNVIFVDEEGEAFKPNNDVNSTYKSNYERGGECEAPYYYPGYVTDNNGYIEYFDCIGEFYAYNYDVWVIGFEENIEGDNSTANIDGHSIKLNTNSNDIFRSTALRFGGSEYGAIFRVTNLGAIEAWVKGKLEMKYAVYDAFGNLVKERGFGKIKRNSLTGQKWLALYDLITGNWTLASHGDKMFERWVEEDGGGSTVNISYTINGINFSYSLKNDDDDLGIATVSFGDNAYWGVPELPNVETVYSISNLDFKRALRIY